MLTILKPWTNEFPSLLNNFLNNEMDENRFKTRGTLPAVNISEDENAYIMEVAAPGMTKKDFSLNIEENLLTIEAVKETSEETEKDNYTRREFNYSSFKRTFTLPETVNQEAISANYKDGILKVELPKKEEAKAKGPKKIEIK